MRTSSFRLRVASILSSFAASSVNFTAPHVNVGQLGANGCYPWAGMQPSLPEWRNSDRVRQAVRRMLQSTAGPTARDECSKQRPFDIRAEQRLQGCAESSETNVLQGSAESRLP